jgi:hypothetical protein
VVFWVVVGYQCFGQLCCLHVQDEVTGDEQRLALPRHAGWQTAPVWLPIGYRLVPPTCSPQLHLRLFLLTANRFTLKYEAVSAPKRRYSTTALHRVSTYDIHSPSKIRSRNSDVQAVSRYSLNL